MWHQFLRQYLNQEHVIQKEVLLAVVPFTCLFSWVYKMIRFNGLNPQLADSKIIRSTARFFVSAIYSMHLTIFRDFWKRIEFFSKTFGEEFKKSLTQKK